MRNIAIQANYTFTFDSKILIPKSEFRRRTRNRNRKFRFRNRNRNRNFGKSKHRKFGEINLQFRLNFDFVECKKGLSWKPFFQSEKGYVINWNSIAEFNSPLSSLLHNTLLYFTVLVSFQSEKCYVIYWNFIAEFPLGNTATLPLLSLLLRIPPSFSLLRTHFSGF
jgi:hypothetical protein